MNAIRSSIRPPYFPAKEATLKRALAPATNPTGLGSAVAAIYAAVVMIVNAAHHHAVIDPQAVIAAIAAAAFLYARFKVTPVADPKDGNGQPLVAPFLAAPRKTLLPPAAARGTDISPLADPPMENLPGPVLPPAAPE